MTLNVKKTQSVLFGTPTMLKSTEALDLKFNDDYIEQVDTFKYLGITLDASVSFKSHVETLTKKVSSKVGVLGRVSKFLPQKYRTMVYNTLVLPHFDYASTIWSNTCPTYIKSLLQLLARAGRIILRAPKLTPTEQVLRDLKWTSLTDRWHCHRAVMMYKVSKGLVPTYLSDGFVPLSQSYGERGPDTRGRSRGNFQVFEGTNNDWGRRRLVTHGVNLWNDLPPEVKNSKSITCFKSSVRNLSKRSYKFYDT